ncbi:MAG: hypothetical protein K940chlam5_00162 [Candidatus Anoxychlamydiales bacterium]|nr:hypothetical protein [Candidatus Anoxychlamydiales bacterium]
MDIHINPILCPAYALEEKSFNKANQPKNKILKELLPRIAAIVAPILYAYQFLTHASIAFAELTLCFVGISSGIIFQYAFESSIISLFNTFSSVLEIPTKLRHGPNTKINIYGDHDRYKMKLHQFPGLM